jgi:GABA(A) receptor-associated protein
LIFHISERRLAEAARIREKYPDRIPVRTHYHDDFLLCMPSFSELNVLILILWQVIVEKAERSDIPDIDKKKLVASALLLYFKMHYYIVLMI